MGLCIAMWLCFINGARWICAQFGYDLLHLNEWLAVIIFFGWVSLFITLDHYLTLWWHRRSK